MVFRVFHLNQGIPDTTSQGVCLNFGHQKSWVSAPPGRKSNQARALKVVQKEYFLTYTLSVNLLKGCLC